MMHDPSFIQIVPYDPAYPALYEAEKQRLLAALGADVRGVEHVGGSSVEGLAGQRDTDIALVMSESWDGRVVSLNERLAPYGYPSQLAPVVKQVAGVRYEVRALPGQSDAIFGPLLERNYLRAHPDEAKRYSDAKIAAAAAANEIPWWSRARRSFDYKQRRGVLFRDAMKERARRWHNGLNGGG